MIKTFLTRLTGKEILLAAVFSCAFALPALAQDANPAPVKGMGPAPLNSKQHQILNGALSSQTRQTLQEAMNSVSTADTSRPATSSK